MGTHVRPLVLAVARPAVSEKMANVMTARAASLAHSVTKPVRRIVKALALSSQAHVMICAKRAGGDERAVNRVHRLASPNPVTSKLGIVWMAARGGTTVIGVNSSAQ
jgi:hypothetical protein